MIQGNTSIDRCSRSSLFEPSVFQHVTDFVRSDHTTVEFALPLLRALRTLPGRREQIKTMAIHSFQTHLAEALPHINSQKKFVDLFQEAIYFHRHVPQGLSTLWNLPVRSDYFDNGRNQILKRGLLNRDRGDLIVAFGMGLLNPASSLKPQNLFKALIYMIDREDKDVLESLIPSIPFSTLSPYRFELLLAWASPEVRILLEKNRPSYPLLKRIKDWLDDGLMKSFHHDKHLAFIKFIFLVLLSSPLIAITELIRFPLNVMAPCFGYQDSEALFSAHKTIEKVLEVTAAILGSPFLFCLCVVQVLFRCCVGTRYRLEEAEAIREQVLAPPIPLV